MNEWIKVGPLGMRVLAGLLLFSGQSIGKDFRLPEAAGKQKPVVLAFYHPWYAAPHGPAKEWRKWDSWKFPERYKPERVKEGWRREGKVRNGKLLPCPRADRSNLW